MSAFETGFFFGCCTGAFIMQLVSYYLSRCLAELRKEFGP